MGKDGRIKKPKHKGKDNSAPGSTKKKSTVIVSAKYHSAGKSNSKMDIKDLLFKKAKIHESDNANSQKDDEEQSENEEAPSHQVDESRAEMTEETKDNMRVTEISE